MCILCYILDTFISSDSKVDKHIVGSWKVRERFEEAYEVSPETAAGPKDSPRPLLCVLGSFVPVPSQWGPPLAMAFKPLVVCDPSPFCAFVGAPQAAPVEGISWAPFPQRLVFSQVPE